MVLSVQEVRNLSMKVDLLIQDQTCNANYIRYSRTDSKTTNDKGKVTQSSNVEPTNIGVGKVKGIMVEKDNTVAPTKNNNSYAKLFSAK